jgi:hypothetical protein
MNRSEKTPTKLAEHRSIHNLSTPILAAGRKEKHL